MSERHDLPLDLGPAHAVLAAKGKPFHELFRIAGLDPSRDFRGANLSGMNLHLADLRGFDLSGADLRGTSFLSARRDGETRTIGATLDAFDADMLERLRRKPKVDAELFLRACRKSKWRAARLRKMGFEWRDALVVHASNLQVIEQILKLDEISGRLELAVYRMAEAANQRSAPVLGNFALFMHEVRGEMDEAERLYRAALAADPKDANTLGNFALFMKNVRGDMDEAERLFRAALAADPKHANNLGNFAEFMHTVRGEMNEAERLYRAALEADPKHANGNGNYARLLIALGREGEALGHIETAMAQAGKNDALRLECWFYRYAVFPEWREQALAEMEKLLRAGVSSPGWDLSGVIRRARELGHPDPERLEALAAAIARRKGVGLAEGLF